GDCMFLLMTSGDQGKTLVGTRVPDACPATVHGGKMSAIRRGGDSELVAGSGIGENRLSCGSVQLLHLHSAYHHKMLAIGQPCPRGHWMVEITKGEGAVPSRGIPNQHTLIINRPGGNVCAIRRPCQRACSPGNALIGEQRRAGGSI